METHSAVKLSHKAAWDRTVTRSQAWKKGFIRALWTDGLHSETLTFHTDRL